MKNSKKYEKYRSGKGGWEKPLIYLIPDPTPNSKKWPP